MSLPTLPFTREGLKELQAELERLKTIERPTVIKAISDARAHGDLRENAEYHAAREKQGFIEARITDLDDKLSRAEIIDYQGGGSIDSIKFGAWVTLEDGNTGEEKKYRIVGDLEADINKNKISLSSPLARALLGKKIDDLVEIEAPKGVRAYSIIDINY